MMKYWIIWLLLTFTGPLLAALTRQVELTADYSTANRDSAHIAPLPQETHEAVIQFYSARAFNWRGMFGSHCWIAAKGEGASSYTVYQVVGWRLWHGLPALSIAEDIPDRNWYNQRPNLILDIRGTRAAALIPKIDDAARHYPYAHPYTLWPGPNSNSFPAYIGRSIPELGLVMPGNAIGKDFLLPGTFFARAPSGTGYQFSLWGVLGITLAKKEGIEIDLLGVSYGVRFAPFTIILPGLV